MLFYNIHYAINFSTLLPLIHLNFKVNTKVKTSNLLALIRMALIRDRLYVKWQSLKDRCVLVLTKTIRYVIQRPLRFDYPCYSDYYNY